MHQDFLNKNLDDLLDCFIKEYEARQILMLAPAFQFGRYVEPTPRLTVTHFLSQTPGKRRSEVGSSRTPLAVHPFCSAAGRGFAGGSATDLQDV